MNTRNAVLAGMAWLSIAVSASAFATIPNVEVTANGDSGSPGSFVRPSGEFAIDGFNLDSLYLDLSFDPSVMSFQVGSSTLSFNGATMPFDAVPPLLFAEGSKAADELGQWHETYTWFSLNSTPVHGPLLFSATFLVQQGIASPPPGAYSVKIMGTMSSDPIFEEREFSSSALVSLVPEPEVWLLWASGLGFLVWRQARRNK